MKSAEKYFVYRIKNDMNSVDRVFTDNEGVLDILRSRGRNNIVTVLRSSTNQYAFLLGDTVAWIDVAEHEEIVETNVSL
jgi:hypothetical protein